MKKSGTTLVAVRIPNDVLEQLPAPIKEPTGKAGTGRAAVIVDLLRRALQETQPDGGENSSPAFSSN